MDPTITTGGAVIHPNNERNETPQIIYSEAAKNYLLFRRRRMIVARDNRDMARDEYDGMTFLKYMDVLKKADDQYIAPRKNAQDTSINTGSIRDKDSSLLEYAMKFDFEPVAQVFDENDEMLEELADTAEDMVRKSKQLEEYRAKAKKIYRSMIAFGTAIVEDLWYERWTLEKTIGKGMKIGSDNTTWTEKRVKTAEGCQAKLWDLKKCYFGDLRKFFMNGPEGQPFFFTVEYESYDRVKEMFGDWDRFKYVPTTLTLTSEMTTGVVYSSGWTLRPVSNNDCEIIRYYDPIANEYAITLNGIDMLPIMDKKVKIKGVEKTLVSGFPLSVVSPSGVIPYAKFDLEPYHEFAISKSQPGKMRVWADVDNMMIKGFIGMFKQKWKPTLGNKSGKTYDSSVTDPATVVNDIRDGDLFPILPNFQGASTSDFSFYEMVKKEIARNSVEDSFQGIDPTTADKTATQDLNEMKASSLKVAAMFDGIVFGENQLNWLRTHNIIKNWTKPIDTHIDIEKKSIVNKYRTVTVSSETEGGSKSTKKIVFTKDTPVRPKGKATLDDSMAIHQKELDHQKQNGSEVREVQLHPEILASMKLNWYYSTVPVPNEADPLSYIMFSKQVNDAILVFGPQSINVKKLKHRFAKLTGTDYDTWFLSERELQQQKAAQPPAAPAAPGSQGSAPVVPGQPSPVAATAGALPANSLGSMT